MSKHHAQTTVMMSLFEAPEAEMDIMVTFEFTKGSAAVLYGDHPQPAENATVEVLEVECRKSRTDAWVKLPAFVADAITDNDETRDWLMSEVDRQHIAAADQAADHRREMAREDRNAA